MTYLTSLFRVRFAHKDVLTHRFSTTPNGQAAGKTIRVTCADSAQLQATVFSPPANQQLKSAILMAPATGIQRYVYSKFSHWLSTHGHAVVTFDNRGIGDSLHGHVRDCKASIVDWGTLDMPAMWSEIQRQFPEAESYHIAGHSAGGQVVGLMENAVNEHGETTITSMFNVNCSSGRLSNMEPLYRLKAKWFLSSYIPLSNYIYGYSKTHLLGMGGPLPYHVGRQWNEWCNGQGYVKTAFGTEVNWHWYDEVSCPSMWIQAEDDEISNLANVKDMLSVHSDEYRKNAEMLTVRPQDYGLEEIGHMNFFSSNNMVLWKIALDWFDRFAPGDRDFNLKTSEPTTTNSKRSS